MKLYNLNFHVNFLKTIFARLPPLASAARCGPHPLATQCARMAVLITISLLIKSEVSSFTHSEDVTGSPTCTKVTNNRLW